MTTRRKIPTKTEKPAETNKLPEPTVETSAGVFCILDADETFDFVRETHFGANSDEVMLRIERDGCYTVYLDRSKVLALAAWLQAIAPSLTDTGARPSKVII